MPYDVRNLRAVADMASPAAGTPTNTLWHYIHPTDSLATIAAANYFNPAAALMRPGDLIIASGAGGTTAGDFYFVTAVTLTTVTHTIEAGTP